MIKFLFAFITSLTLIACGSSVQTLSYRPAGSNEPMWKVSAEKNNLTNKVEVKINDSTVCEGSIGLFNSGEDLKGEYHGHKVVAMLQKTNSLLGGEKMTVLVMIDGEMAGKVEF